MLQVSHSHRVRRFAEGFFTMSNPRQSALCCLDAKHQHYSLVTEAVRKSAYFTSLPNLTVGCKDLDGTAETLPIIFEECGIFGKNIERKIFFRAVNRKRELRFNMSKVELRLMVFKK